MMEKEKTFDTDKEAVTNLVIELYKAECKRTFKYQIICYILTALLFVSVIIGLMLSKELASYETVTVTTTETYTNDIDGDNANVVNGNQYNDNATHNENGGAE